VSVQTATKEWEGVEVPAAGTWRIDRSHSTVGFVARHLMVAKVRGRFGEFDGVLRVAERPEDSTVEVTIDASSIDTRDQKRDEHLRSGDFLDSASFPTLSFKGSGLRQTGKTTFDLPGELTIRGISKPVVLNVDFDGIVADPWGNARAVFTAETEIDREEYGLTWNVALETGGVLVGKNIKIVIEVEAVREAA
jgi:polyisoprenoid-binding protein YceI